MNMASIAEESEDFDLSFISNCGVQSGARSSRFTCKLDTPLVLDKTYKWDVGLSKLSLSRLISLFSNDDPDSRTISFAWSGKKRMSSNILGKVSIVVPVQFSIWDPQSLLMFLRQHPSLKKVTSTSVGSDQAELIDLNSVIRIRFDVSTQHFQFCVKRDNPVGAVSAEISFKTNPKSPLKNNISAVMGAKDINRCEACRWSTFPYPAEILSQVSYMNMKCSLTRDGSLGLYPLAYWMSQDHWHKEDETCLILVKEFIKPHYHPVSVNIFSNVSFALTNHVGQELFISPDSAPTTLELSFKRTARAIP